MKCQGCQFEMQDCYNYQEEGYDAGLHFGICPDGKEHCYMFLIDKNGEPQGLDFE